MFEINSTISIPLSEIEISAVRAEGPGGQHVNKTSSAVQIRFNIKTSTLTEYVKVRLLNMSDHRITSSGEILIKSQEHRSMFRNKETAFEKLRQLILKSLVVVKKRKPTKPTRSSVRKRVDSKKKQGHGEKAQK